MAARICVSSILIAVFFINAVASCKCKKESKLGDSGNNRFSIIGGHEVDIKDHPYQAAVFGPNQYFRCGGTIITKDFVLTVRDCLVNETPATLTVGVGHSMIANLTIIKAAELIMDPDSLEAYNDCAAGLIRTATPMQFSEFVKPIQITRKHQPLEDGSMINITGWGMTRKDEVSPHLMGIEIPVVNFYKCWMSYNTIHAILTRNMWCAGDFDHGSKAPCYGDAGSAAVQNNIAVGIDYGAVGCGKPKFPAIFIDIAAPCVWNFIAKYTGI